MSDQPRYPHADGERAVLGPDVYATADGMVIFWQGAKYRRDYGPAAPTEAVSARVSAPQTDGGAAEGRDGERGSGGRETLRERLAEALMRWAEGNNNPSYARIRRPETVTKNAYARADAVLAVVKPLIRQHEEATKYWFDAASERLATIERLRRLARYTRDRTETGESDWAIGQHELAQTVLDTLAVEFVSDKPAHDAGPSIAECAEADRNWDVEKAGE